MSKIKTSTTIQSLFQTIICFQLWCSLKKIIIVYYLKNYTSYNKSDHTDFFLVKSVIIDELDAFKENRKNLFIFSK